MRWDELEPAMCGPGSIRRRQSTFWELVSATGTACQVELVDKAEFWFDGAEYPSVAVVTEHPLLLDHQEPNERMFFAGRAIDAEVLAQRIDDAIREASGGWRDLERYAGRRAGVVDRLRAGDGWLMSGPVSVCANVSRILGKADIRTTTPGRATAPLSKGRCVLLLGRSYVVAGEFRFRCETTAP